MILEPIDDPVKTRALSPHFAAAVRFIQAADWDSLPMGRTDIEGDDLFVLKQEYLTQAPTGVWESHRRYADIHLLLSGEEHIGLARLSDLQPTGSYNEKEDYALYAGDGDFVHLTPGSLMVLLPSDGHMPTIAVGEPAQVRKIVLKVSVRDGGDLT